MAGWFPESGSRRGKARQEHGHRKLHFPPRAPGPTHSLQTPRGRDGRWAVTWGEVGRCWPVRLAWGRVPGQEGGATASVCSQTESPRPLALTAGSPSLSPAPGPALTTTGRQQPPGPWPRPHPPWLRWEHRLCRPDAELVWTSMRSGAPGSGLNPGPAGDTLRFPDGPRAAPGSERGLSCHVTNHAVHGTLSSGAGVLSSPRHPEKEPPPHGQQQHSPGEAWEHRLSTD